MRNILRIGLESGQIGFLVTKSKRNFIQSTPRLFYILFPRVVTTRTYLLSHPQNMLNENYLDEKVFVVFIPTLRFRRISQSNTQRENSHQMIEVCDEYLFRYLVSWSCEFRNWGGD
jgi:hypothetical protein